MKCTDKDVAGNIAYGCLGRVLRIPDMVLYVGAGYA